MGSLNWKEISSKQGLPLDSLEMETTYKYATFSSLLKSSMQNIKQGGLILVRHTNAIMGRIIPGSTMLPTMRTLPVS